MTPNPQDFYSHDLAESEGWFISHAAGNLDGTTWRLERDDAAAIFDGDPAAHAHVVDAALNGNTNAMRALIFLATFEPREVAEIEKHAEAAGVWDTDHESPWEYEFGTLAQEKLAAIRARVSGIWDHPALVWFDGLHTDLESDVLTIVGTWHNRLTETQTEGPAPWQSSKPSAPSRTSTRARLNRSASSAWKASARSKTSTRCSPRSKATTTSCPSKTR